MTSIHPFDPTTVNQALAELPPLPIAALMIGVYNLLQEGADLPSPCYICASETAQQIEMQFPGTQPSRRAITVWAHCFGSAVTQHPHHDARGEFTRITATFSYYGLTVKTYAYIPIAGQVARHD
jgi:hypothetical protein